VADAASAQSGSALFVTLAGAAAVGELRQMADGRAGFLRDRTAGVSGQRRAFAVAPDVVVVTKTAGVVILDGGDVFWDHSANAATYKKVSDRDFYLGRAVGDAASADTTMAVALNVDPRADIDLGRDGFQSVLVGTPAAGGFGYPVNLGGSLIFELDATNQAQKVDALGVDGFSKDANAIVDLVFRVLSDGSGTAVDASLGVAGATHASDADSIAESVFVHLDANNTNINLESDDGTTEVAATDTTLDYAEGADLATRVYVSMDFRNPADVQVYVNGANVLPATVFNVNAAVGPLFPLIHLEKTAGTDTYKLAVDKFRVRLMEQ
jgi:hypothetical protein